MLNPNQIPDLLALLQFLSSQQQGSGNQPQRQFVGLPGLSSSRQGGLDDFGSGLGGGVSSGGLGVMGGGLSSGGLGGLGGMTGPGGGLGGGVTQDHDPLGSRVVDLFNAVISTAKSFPGPHQPVAMIARGIMGALAAAGVATPGKTNKYAELFGSAPLPYVGAVRDWMRFLRVDPQVLPQPAIDPLAESMSSITDPNDPLQDPPEDYRDFETGVTASSYGNAPATDPYSNPEAYAAAAYGPSAYGNQPGSPLGVSWTDLDAFAADYSGLSFSDPPDFDFSTDFAGIAGNDPAGPADPSQDEYGGYGGSDPDDSTGDGSGGGGGGGAGGSGADGADGESGSGDL